jgi:peptide chain release factor 2
MLEPDFWQNKNSNTINQVLNNLIIDENIYQDALTLEQLFDEEDDLLVEEINKFIEQHYVKTLFNHENDKANALFEIKISSGGTEALDFAKMLYNMYMHFFKRQKWDVRIMHINEEHPGIKDIVLEVKGKNVYGMLKLEEGVHRLIRISPFDANGKRHTTFANCHVTPLKEENKKIILSPGDIQIQTYRSSGAGGQSVNTTDSAVRIRHIPTGVVVTCQNERSQLQNKEQALEILKHKLAIIQEQENQSESKILGAWGNQIKTYTLHPYSMYKDHRFAIEKSNVQKILAGHLEEVIVDSIIKYNKLEGK